MSLIDDIANANPMSRLEAAEYAPQWGSLIRGGDPGACMYGDLSDSATCAAYVRDHCLPHAEGEDRLEVRRLLAYFESEPVRRGFVSLVQEYAAGSDDTGPDDTVDLDTDTLATLGDIVDSFIAAASADDVARYVERFGADRMGSDLAFTVLGTGIGFRDRLVYDLPLANRPADGRAWAERLEAAADKACLELNVEATTAGLMIF